MISTFKKRAFLGIMCAKVELLKQKDKKSKAKIAYLVILKADCAPTARYSESDSDGSKSDSAHRADSSSMSSSEEDRSGASECEGESSTCSTTASTSVVYSWANTKAQKSLMDIRTRQLFWKKNGRESVTVSMAADAKLPEVAKEGSATLPERHAQQMNDEEHPKYLFGEEKSKWKAGVYPPTVRILPEEEVPLKVDAAAKKAEVTKGTAKKRPAGAKSKGSKGAAKKARKS